MINNKTPKFSSLSEWRKAKLHAYIAARAKGLIPKICKEFNWAEIPVKDFKKPGEWTYEKCLESALKFTKKTDWFKNENRAYHAANRNGWIDKCCSHMPNVKKPQNYWTKERCIDEALKYYTTKEWAEKGSSSYSTAKHKGWLIECSKHMIALIKPDGYWTLEQCKKDALNYNTIREWEIKDKTSYSIARKKQFFNQCISHMKEIKKPQNYWTLELCIESASKYITATEWHKKEGGAYAASLKKGWYQECIQHIKKNKHKK